MPLGDNYASLAELKSRLGITDTTDDTALSNALSAISRNVEEYTSRQFNDAGTTSARIYRPDSCLWVDVDDFSTDTGLIVQTDDGDDGNFDTTWPVSDFQLEPLNGIVDGQTGWPYSTIRSVATRWLWRRRRASVRVTARWGWTAIPTPIREATLILGEETFKLKDAPFGVAGFGDFGVVRIRDNPKATALLDPYRRYGVLVG
jgi:hypothetical protein